MEPDDREASGMMAEHQPMMERYAAQQGPYASGLAPQYAMLGHLGFGLVAAQRMGFLGHSGFGMRDDHRASLVSEHERDVQTRCVKIGRIASELVTICGGPAEGQAEYVEPPDETAEVHEKIRYIEQMMEELAWRVTTMVARQKP